ncbi:type II toxin-antitoxin system VapC family toxin, partial [Geminisphaera colitermitum]
MVLVDSNILIDIFTDDPVWGEWSAEQLLAVSVTDELAINPLIYAEISIAYRTAGELQKALRPWPLEHLPLPYEAGFIAGQAFLAYRKEHKGQKRSPLPDFYIGAHAQVSGLRL